MEQTIFEKRGEEFASVQVRRTTTGVELTIRSTAVEAFCRSLHEQAVAEHGYTRAGTTRFQEKWDELMEAREDDANPSLSQLKFYRMPTDRMLPPGTVKSALTGCSYGYNQTLMIRANPPVPNMLWFRAEGIGTGLVIQVPGLQMRDVLKAYVASVKQTLTEMYANYLRPFDQRVVFTSEILEVKQ